ncbi:unnamed protein product [Leptidea sinapis]|uniref:Uncharacterized protein n=1 Tax=Leptidea sinapis TaxID=189913 RepID=A0A5E4PMT4_9NEOP|nr:unnamed protein product [Leptidea sinapis]
MRKPAHRDVSALTLTLARHGIPAPAAAPRDAARASATAPARAAHAAALAHVHPARAPPGRRPLEPVPHLETARLRQRQVGEQ